MQFLAIAMGILALTAPLSALPHSETEVLEQLRGVPDGWLQVGVRLSSHTKVLIHL